MPFQIAVFAIPAPGCCLTAHGGELKCGHRTSSGSEWESDDSNSTNEEYQKIISGEGLNDPNDDDKIQKLLSIFQSADIDNSGTMNVGEFGNHFKDKLESVSWTIDGSNGSFVSDLRHRIIKLESKVDTMSVKLDQLIEMVHETRVNPRMA